MTLTRLFLGRQGFVRGAFGALLLVLASGRALPADQFPFDQELLLEAAPMRPAKRVPILTVTPDGNATIDLWCRSVPGRVELSDATIRIELGPLPEGLPEMMSAGQCTPQRLQADEDMLAALVQVSEWQMQAGALVLVGPTTMRFRVSSH